MLKWLLIVCTCFFATQLWGQEVSFRRYSVGEGLAGSTIYCVFQDSREFLWVTTETGVSRFDGKTFINYTTKNGLGDNEIISIGEDVLGRVWFAGYNGTISYYKNDSIYPFYSNKNTKQLLSVGLISGMINDSAGNFWMWGENMIRITGDDYQVFLMKYDDSAQKIAYCIASQNNSFLAATTRHITRLRDGEIIEKILLPDEFRYKVRGIIPYAGGYILFSSHVIVWCILQNNTLSVQKRISIDATINFVKQDNVEGFWVTTFNGGMMYYPDLFANPANHETYLAGRSIGHLTHDSEGGLWVVVNGDALYYLVNNNTIHYDLNLPQRLNNIYAVTGGKNDAVYAGLGNSSIYILEKDKMAELHTDGLPVIGYNRVKDMVMIDGYLWIATDYGLFVQSPSGKIEGMKELGAIKTLAVDSSGMLLVGNYEGAYIINPQKPYKRQRIFDKRTIAICVGRGGEVWLGTLLGLFRYHPATGNVTEYNTGMQKHKSVTCLGYAKNGVLWMGTNDAGMMAITGNKVVVYNQDGGLAGDICKSVFIDAKARVWVGTSTGLSCLSANPSGTMDIRNYTVMDGLKSPQVNDIYVHNDSVWLATSSGLTLLLNHEKGIRTHSPPVYINSVSVRNVQVGFKNGISLPYASNSLNFSFTGISFRSAGMVSYRYRMVGLHNDWKYTGNTTVEYASLPPGSYSFEVYASNYFKVWSKTPAVFSFTIQTPYWQTPWFITLLVVLALAVITFIIYWVKRNESRKNTLQKKMIQLELEAVKAQLNPHFVFNCLNSIQYFLNENDQQSAQGYLVRFARLIRHTLEYSASSYILLEDELKYLDDYLTLERMRLNERFEYKIGAHLPTNVSNILVPPMLIQIYIENAVRHGLRPMKQKGGQLNVIFTGTADYLICTIDDNGIGRQAASQMGEGLGHLSMGMKINRHRIDMLNSINENDIIFEITDKTIATHGETGTIIKISIPYTFNSKL